MREATLVLGGKRLRAGDGLLVRRSPLRAPVFDEMTRLVFGSDAGESGQDHDSRRLNPGARWSIF